MRMQRAATLIAKIPPQDASKPSKVKEWITSAQLTEGRNGLSVEVSCDQEEADEVAQTCSQSSR